MNERNFCSLKNVNVFSCRASFFVVLCWFLTIAGGFTADAERLPLREEQGAISLSMQKGRDDSVLLTLRASEVKDAKVFWFSNPDRIIADLPFRAGAPDWYRKIPLENGGVVKSLRVGSHATKVRFVLDLGIAAKGSFQTSVSGDVLKVLVNSKDPIKEFIEEAQPIRAAATPTSKRIPTATPAAKASPTPTPPPTATPSPVPTRTPTSTATPRITVALKQPTVAPTMNAVELNPNDIEKPHAKSVKLTALGFEKGLKGQQGLKLKFSRAVGYQLVRRSKELYILIVENAGLTSAELALPHFPPQDFEGFVSVRAQSRDDQVQVFIYIDDGTHLLSVPYGSEIWLKTTNK